MQEMGVDEKGRKLVVDGDNLSIVLSTGQRATYSRKFLNKLIAERQAEIDKFQEYLALLDKAASATK